MNKRWGIQLSAIKGYLSLNDYSARYHISLSTLRRRIRTGEIEYRFEGGKYWLAEDPPKKYGRVMDQTVRERNLNSLAANTRVNESEPAKLDSNLLIRPPETFLDSAKTMVQELKVAYVSVLHEKEKQITNLKEEISDLKTLVKILENENERLKSNGRESAPIDSWLESDAPLELRTDEN